MEEYLGFFWIEFISSCLPDIVKNYYDNQSNQAKYCFQTFKQRNTFWVRQSLKKNNSVDFDLDVFCNNWINLPYALHQEWNEEDKDSEGKQLAYFQVESYRVCQNTIKQSDTLTFQGKSYYIKKIYTPLSMETYRIGLKQ